MSKISVKSVCGKIGRPEAPVIIMRVFGIVAKVEMIETAYGETYRFKGDFIAIDTKTGKETRADVAHFPAAVEDILRPAVVNIGRDLEFALDIGVRPAGNNIGYEYGVRMILNPFKADPMEVLRQRVIQATQPQPEKEPEQKPEPEKEQESPAKKTGKK